LSNVFPEPGLARSWLQYVVDTIFALVKMTTFAAIGELQFSCMEALYSHGFTTIEKVASLTADQFQSALLGTIIYVHTDNIRKKYVPNEPVTTTDSESGRFIPINPDGLLIDCIPPPNLSPLGIIQYLHELLTIPLGDSIVGILVIDRRDPIGQLYTTMANLEIPVPRIDMVNESLEALAVGLQLPGAINDTNGQKLAGFDLGSPPSQPPSEIYAAIPEHSSPATDKPVVYDTLKNCFTSPDLPYNQGLDISRSYLSSIGITRFETMRHFRKDITELAMDATLEPDDFQRSQWRFPVRFEIALEYLNIS
jgi:hypothetical protein